MLMNYLYFLKISYKTLQSKLVFIIFGL